MNDPVNSPDSELLNIVLILGRAITEIQLLEESLLLIIAFRGIPMTAEKGSAEAEEVFHEIYTARSMKMLGKNLKLFKDMHPIPDDIAQILEDARNARNIIVHHFMKKIGRHLITSSGREIALHSLQVYRSKIRKACDNIFPITDVLMKEHGMDMDILLRDISKHISMSSRNDI